MSKRVARSNQQPPSSQTPPRKRRRPVPGAVAITVVGAVLGIGLLAIAVALVNVQIFQGSKLRSAAQDARVRALTIPAQRGGIFDRHGQPLATSVTVYTMTVDPVRIKFKGDLAQVVSEILDGDATEYYQKMLRPSHYAVLAKQITQQQREDFERYVKSLPTETAEQRSLKGQYANLINFELDYKRRYPLNSTAAQVIGFVGGDPAGGLAGIELYYDDLLTGTPGSSTSERDVLGNLIPSGIQHEIPATAGQSIMLTIDSHIQAMAEQELKSAVKKHNAKAGAVIVMDPRNGELYAAASYPTFDLNAFSKANDEQFRGRALVDLYEPGSTMKCITAAGVLGSGKVTPRTTFVVPDSMQVGSRRVRDSHPHPTEKMTFTEIIGDSSNVGTTKAAYKLGDHGLYNTFKQFGFFEKPGLDFPGTTYGRALKPSEWSDVSLSNYSFGQGISVTPVMLTRAIGALANKGTLVTPHLLKDVPEDRSQVPVWATKQATSEKIADQTTEILKKVMTKGTGKDIKVDGFTVAGKTGTAQKALPGKGYVVGKYIGSFIGYLPADNPELIVLVLLDEPRGSAYYGGLVAGPSFARIAEFAANHLEITPDRSIKKKKATKVVTVDEQASTDEEETPAD